MGKTDTSKKGTQKKGAQDIHEDRMPLTRHNYVLILIGFGLVVLGFILMAGGKSQGPDDFNYAMFSFRRITLAPIVALGGFAFVIYGIMKKDRSRK